MLDHPGPRVGVFHKVHPRTLHGLGQSALQGRRIRRNGAENERTFGSVRGASISERLAVFEHSLEVTPPDVVASFLEGMRDLRRDAGIVVVSDNRRLEDGGTEW